MLARLLREPLVHFLLLGGVLFLGAGHRRTPALLTGRSSLAGLISAPQLPGAKVCLAPLRTPNLPFHFRSIYGRELPVRSAAHVRPKVP